MSFMVTILGRGAQLLYWLPVVLFAIYFWKQYDWIKFWLSFVFMVAYG